MQLYSLIDTMPTFYKLKTKILRPIYGLLDQTLLEIRHVIKPNKVASP